MKCKTTLVFLPSECRNSHQHNNPRYAVTELIKKKKTQFLQKDKAYIDHRWTILLNPAPQPEINALMSKTDQAETYLLPCTDCLHLQAPHSKCRRRIGAAQRCGAVSGTVSAQSPPCQALSCTHRASGTCREPVLLQGCWSWSHSWEIHSVLESGSGCPLS